MSETYFRVYSGLLTVEHKKNIGPALWEFLWCIDRVTKEVDGEGLVLGGSPVSYSQVAEELGSGKSTVKRNFERLEEHGYIFLKRTPYGHIITVKKSKKWGAINSTQKGANNGTGAENGTESANNGTQGAENGHSNKDNIETIQDINTTATISEPKNENSVSMSESGGVPTTDLIRGDPVYVPAVTGEVPHTLDTKKVILNKFVELRGYGFHWSPVDEEAAQEIIDAGVSIEDAITWMKESFENYKPKHSRSRINTLKYCVGYILDKHYHKQNAKVIRPDFKNKKPSNYDALKQYAMQHGIEWEG